ncbi:MAG: cupin domain-containing protein [Chlorobi bacterium]|nr:cupin domain-containing protein [Chlorobiota bacterium]
MKIISLNDVEKKKVNMSGAEKAWKQMPLSTADGVPVFSWRVFTIEPGGQTPFHQHPYEHMNYVIEGEGVLVDIEGNERTIKQGYFALVMPNEKHQYRNKSADKPFVMICGVPKQFE